MSTSKYPQTLSLEYEDEGEAGDGDLEATKGAANEPWEIASPWGHERYHGTATQARARMRRIVADAKNAEADADARKKRKPNRRCAGSFANRRCAQEAEFDEVDAQCTECYGSDQAMEPR